MPKANHNALRSLQSTLRRWDLIPYLQRDLQKGDYIIQEGVFRHIVATGRSGPNGEAYMLAYEDGTIEQFTDNKFVVKAIPTKH